MKTLFTAAVAAVFLLLIGWSLLSDSRESANPERIDQEFAQDRSQEATRRSVERTNSVPVGVPVQENEDVSQAIDLPVTEEVTTGPASRSQNSTVNQTVQSRQQTPVKQVVQQTDPGDMPNDKFVRDLERYQGISHRNYEEILRLVNQQVTRKE